MSSRFIEEDVLDYEFDELDELTGLTAEELEQQLELEMSTLLPTEEVKPTKTVVAEKTETGKPINSVADNKVEEKPTLTAAASVEGANAEDRGSKDKGKQEAGLVKQEEGIKEKEAEPKVERTSSAEVKQQNKKDKETNPEVVSAEGKAITAAEEKKRSAEHEKRKDIADKEAVESGEVKSPTQDVKKSAPAASATGTAVTPRPNNYGHRQAYNAPPMYNRYHQMHSVYPGFYMPHMPPFPMSAMPYQHMPQPTGNRIYVNPKFQQRQQQQSNVHPKDEARADSSNRSPRRTPSPRRTASPRRSPDSRKTASPQRSSNSRGSPYTRRSPSPLKRSHTATDDPFKARPLDADKHFDQHLAALRRQAASSVRRRSSDKGINHRAGQDSRLYNSDHSNSGTRTSDARSQRNSRSHTDHRSRTGSRSPTNSRSHTDSRSHIDSRSLNDSSGRFARTVIMSSIGHKRNRDHGDTILDDNENNHSREVKRRHSNEYHHKRAQSPPRSSNGNQPERVITIRGRNAGHTNPFSDDNTRSTAHISTASPSSDRRRIVIKGHDSKQDIKSRLGNKPYERKKSQSPPPILSRLGNTTSTASLVVKNVPNDKFDEFKALCPSSAVLKNGDGCVSLTFRSEEEAKLFRRKYNRYQLGTNNIIVAFKK